MSFLLTAKGAIQKEVVYFGLSKQEVVLLQRPTGEFKTWSHSNPMLCTAVINVIVKTLTTIML